MEFFVLGPLEVRAGGNQIAVTGRRQRILLALLLLHANEVVSRDRLIDELWQSRPPETAGNALHGLVSQLRKLLDSPGETMPLVTRPPGYSLEVDPVRIDLHRFEDRLELGRQALAVGEPARAGELLRGALGLWRGRLLEDLGDAQFVLAEAGRVDELHLQVLEERIEADLRSGRPDALVPELQALVAREPYRERFRRQLMLALYRSGRQADALDAYRDARRLFVEELGIDPSPELQELERSILQQDAALGPPAAAAVPARRRHRTVAAVAAGLLAVAGAVTGLVVALRGGSDEPALAGSPANAVAVIDPRTNRLVDSIPVGSTPIAVALGEGSVWTVNSEDGTLSRIDPETRTIVRTIGLGTPATDVVVAFGSVWVANGTAGSLARVDPATNSLAETFHQPVEVPLVSPANSALAAGSDSLWLASGTRRVLRVDPRSGRTLAAVTVPAGPLALGFGGGSVWVGSLARRVTRIATQTDSVTASVPVNNETEGIAVGAGAVWATVCCDSVWRIDPTTNVLTGTVRVGDVPSGIAVGEGSVWVSSYGDGTVSRIDPATGGVLATIRVGHGAVDLAVGYGSVWVAVQPREVN